MRRLLIPSKVHLFPLLSDVVRPTQNISYNIINAVNVTSYRSFALHHTSNLLSEEAVEKVEDTYSWGTSPSPNNEVSEWQQMIPATERVSRSLTPGVVLYTVRHDPGMTIQYYTRRYFGGDTPESMATLNHILWSQLKKYGKAYVKRDSNTSECTWYPMQKTYGRLTRVLHHRSEDEDLSLLSDYIPPAPTFPNPLPPPIPARVMRRRSLSDTPSLPPWSPRRESQEANKPPQQTDDEQAKMFAAASETRSVAAVAATHTHKISDTLKATVVAVMEEALVLVQNAPNQPITYYMELLSSDEHRLAASAAFKQLAYNGLLKKEKQKDGPGSTWVITPMGQEALDAKPKVLSLPLTS